MNNRRVIATVIEHEVGTDMWIVVEHYRYGGWSVIGRYENEHEARKARG